MPNEGEIQKFIQMSRNKLYKEQKVKLEKAYKNRDYSEAGQNEK